jgi:hypothetical protein
VTGITSSTNFPTTAGASQTTNQGVVDAFVTKLNPAGSGLLYSTYLGGSDYDQALGIAVDVAGDAYVTGYTFSRNFPITAGAFQTTNPGTSYAFVTKLNPTGSGLLYSTYLGGEATFANAIAVDDAGDAYVTGRTYANFPTTVGAFQTTTQGSYDAFVTKLNPTGSGLLYSTYLGGTDYDVGNGIAVNAAGDAYVTGTTYSTDFPITAAAFQPTGSYDAFVTKLNPEGSGLLYSTYLGGSSYDYGNGIAADAAGNAYVTGYTYSPDFPTTAGAFQTTYHGSYDAFVSKLNPAGTGLFYSTYLGGSNTDAGQGIAVDAAGDAYVTGYTASTNFPTTAEAFQTTNQSSYDAFVTKLNPAGSDVLYSTYLGGSGNDFGYGIAVDAAGAAYVAGVTNSTNFPTTLGAFQTTNQGSYDAFVTKLAFSPTFAGTPGYSNCHGKSVAALAQQFGGIDAAAAALGYPSVQALQDAIRTFCRV